MKLWLFGAPGSGKTTLAKKLGAHYKAPHHELDSFFWAPNWTINPEAEFLNKVQAVVKTDHWIIDGNYTAVGRLLSQHAEGIIWVDLHFAITYPRVLQRSLSDAWTGRVLFSENRESFKRILSKDGMPAYAFTRRRRNQARFEGFWSGFLGPKARLTSPHAVLDEAIRFCDALP
jgi:adenylate kinase family enzyme